LVHQPFSILSASFSHLWPFCTFFVPVVTWLLTSLDISCCQNLSDTGPNAPRWNQTISRYCHSKEPFSRHSTCATVVWRFPSNAGCHQVCH
jgi:hypothetical protein